MAMSPTNEASLQRSIESKSPNVIYILADDLGYGDLGCYGQRHFATPYIDAMAKSGMLFTQNYAGSSVSAPSRCSILTGKDSGHGYIRGNQAATKPPINEDGRNYGHPLAQGEVTLAEIFKQAGYQTACIGKWGLGGPNTTGSPNAQGFDYFYGYLSQGDAHKHYPTYLHENDKFVELDGSQYSHDIFEQKAMDYITECREKPFFLYLAFTLVHAELLIDEQELSVERGRFEEPKPFVQGKSSYGSQESPRAAFAAMARRLDLSVGRINELLARLGMEENTLVIFTSDNGPHMEGGADPEFFDSNGIYRGIKRDLYEGGIRVPMIATWQGEIAEGSTCDDPVAFWDILPTMAELIGVETPAECDGVSLLPAFGGQSAPRQRHLYWELNQQGGKQAIRVGDWKLLRLNTKLAEQSYYELYNIANDPEESNNLIETEREMAAKLKQAMGEARTESELYTIF